MSAQLLLPRKSQIDFGMFKHVCRTISFQGFTGEDHIDAFVFDILGKLALPVIWAKAPFTATTAMFSSTDWNATFTLSGRPISNHLLSDLLLEALVFIILLFQTGMLKIFL